MQASTTYASLYVLFRTMYKSESGQHILTLKPAAVSTPSISPAEIPTRKKCNLKPSLMLKNYKLEGPMVCMYLRKTCISIIHTGRQDGADCRL